VPEQNVITGEAPKRYASALLELATEAKSLNSVEKDVKSLVKMFSGSAELKALASNPVYANEDKVSSASKMTAADLTALKAKLKKSAGKTVTVETSIDPDLLGGFIVQIGSRLYDNSLKTKLEDLRLALKDA